MSFGAAAMFSLLPATVLLSLLLVEAGAHAVLGLSGSLLAAATGWIGQSADAGFALPSWRSLPLATGATLAVSLAGALPASLCVLLASRRPTSRARALVAAASAAATASLVAASRLSGDVSGTVLAPVAAMPGLVAGLLLFLSGRTGTG